MKLLIKQTLKKTSIFLMILTAICLLCTGAVAVDPPLPDDGIPCTLTVSVKNANDGCVSIWRVASEADGSWQYADAYASCTLALSQDENELSEALYRFTLENGIFGSEAVITSEAAEFSGLQAGLYLVAQTRSSSGCEDFMPFLIGLPYASPSAAGALHSATAAPKNEPDVPGSDLQNTPPPSFLPQTGQLWWPVCALFGCAMAAFLCAWIVHRRTRR